MEDNSHNSMEDIGAYHNISLGVYFDDNFKDIFWNALSLSSIILQNPPISSTLMEDMEDNGHNGMQDMEDNRA